LLKELSRVNLVWSVVSFLDLDVRFVADTVKILVQSIKQKCHKFLRVLLLIAGELRLESTDCSLKYVALSLAQPIKQTK